MLYPKKFRAPRVLFLGCGRTAIGLAQQLKGVGRLSGLITQAHKVPLLQDSSIVPILGNAAYRKTLQRLRGLAQNIFIFVPPQQETQTDRPIIDRYSHHLSIILRQPMRFSRVFFPLQYRQKTTKIIYASTTGVYGDTRGEWVQEHSPKKSTTLRSVKRIAAENTWLAIAPQRTRQPHLSPFRTSILRISGIYGKDLLPIERILKGTPIFTASEDRYTNHITLDDLVRVCRWTLYRGRAQRSYNTSDTQPILYGDYIRAVCQTLQMPVPPEVNAATLQPLVTPMMWSFLSESRRVCTQRLQQEIQAPLQYPHTEDVLKAYEQETRTASTNR